MSVFDRLFLSLCVFFVYVNLFLLVPLEYFAYKGHNHDDDNEAHNDKDNDHNTDNDDDNYVIMIITPITMTQ